MKAFLIITLLFLFVQVVFGQSITYDYDTIASSEIKVNDFCLFTSKSKLLSLLKKADSVRYYDEMGDCTTTAVHFKKSIIYLCDTLFDGFDVFDNSLSILIKKQRIKVGDDLKTVEKMFPKSYLIRNNDELGKTDITIYVSDYEGLSFIINTQNRIIEILYWEDTD